MYGSGLTPARVAGNIRYNICISCFWFNNISYLDEINMCLREHLLYTYNMVCVVKIIQFFYAPPLSIIYIEGEKNKTIQGFKTVFCQVQYSVSKGSLPRVLSVSLQAGVSYRFTNTMH